jgi:hypothetical protein
MRKISEFDPNTFSGFVITQCSLAEPSTPQTKIKSTLQAQMDYKHSFHSYNPLQFNREFHPSI